MTNKKPKWEKKFDRKFECFPGGLYIKNTHRPAQEKEIKQFISNLLKEQRDKEILEMIEELEEIDEYGSVADGDYNQALQDLKDKLNTPNKGE